MKKCERKVIHNIQVDHLYQEKSWKRKLETHVKLVHQRFARFGIIFPDSAISPIPPVPVNRFELPRVNVGQILDDGWGYEVL